MATIRKLGKGWRAEVQRQGQRRSKVLPTKREATDWAAREEYLILNGDKVAAATPFRDVLDRYAREVTPGQRGKRWEEFRLAAFGRDKIGAIPIGKLTTAHLADWRDRRLLEVSPATVLRESGLISGVLTRARREWGMIAVNPMSDVRKPAKPPARTRLVTADELVQLHALAGDDLSRTTGRCFHAFLFAIETAMRAGEICGLRWSCVDLDSQVARLPITKNGDVRDVPLSREAVRLLKALPRAEPVFRLGSDSLSSLWRKLTAKAKIEDLHFHDSRATAITRLSRKLDPLALAKMVGHRDLRVTMGYYRETAADLAKRLD